MRREELKQAAIRVFSEHGYHAAKVSQIVARAGVAQGTFYLYFQSKQALFGEILADYLRLVTTAVSSWEIQTLSDVEQLREQLFGIGIELTHVMMDNRDLTRIFFQEALAVDPAFSDQIGRFYTAVIALIRLVNETCYERGIYRDVDFDVMAHAVVGMIERVIYNYVVTDRLQHLAPETVVNEMIDLVLMGAAVGRA